MLPKLLFCAKGVMELLSEVVAKVQNKSSTLAARRWLSEYVAGVALCEGGHQHWMPELPLEVVVEARSWSPSEYITEV